MSSPSVIVLDGGSVERFLVQSDRRRAERPVRAAMTDRLVAEVELERDGFAVVPDRAATFLSEAGVSEGDVEAVAVARDVFDQRSGGVEAELVAVGRRAIAVAVV